jgi:hypothetical protein
LEIEIILAEFLNQRGRFREAEELAKKTFILSGEVYRSGFSLTCRSAAVLGDSYHHQGRPEEALLMMEKAFRGYVQTHGPDYPPTKECERKIIMLTQEKGTIAKFSRRIICEPEPAT